MGLGRITRPLSWPLRRFFDRRFDAVLPRVDTAREEAGAAERSAHGRHQELQRQLEVVQEEVATLYRLLRPDMDATSEAVELRAHAMAQMGASPPRVSVVIPSLNRANRLVRLLHALSEQAEVEPFEVVVADDGSTDGTVERVNRQAQHLSYLLHVIPCRTRTGAGPARNRGWKEATGDLVVFIDDDCVPERGWLATLVSAMEAHDVVVGRTKPAEDQLHLRGPFSMYMDVWSKWCYPTCNIGYRRPVLGKLDGFDEETFRLHNGEDADLGIRAEKAGFRTEYEPRAVVYHDVRPSEFLPYLRRVRDRDAIVALIARHPEARRRVSEGWWLRPADKAIPLLWAAALVLARNPRSQAARRFSVATGVWYLWQFRHSYYRHRSLGELVAAIPLGLIADSWSMVVMIRGSIRYKALVL
jgi:glycosyltransferase involved in cell wall biosynthesis